MRYRSRTDIMAHILESANGGAAKTKLMYKAYLSYAQLKDYLELLAENGLIEYDQITQTYKTTEKGLGFKQAYNKLGEYVAPEQKYRRPTIP